MKPLLPREFLWTDKQTMDEFFRLDRINEDFFEVFTTLREEPFAVQMDEVKVFNEVYYQVTRMVYELPMPSELDNYIKDIKANMGWNYSAELVMSMAYYMLALIDKMERPINKFFTKAINEKFFGCLYWKPFKHKFEQLKKSKRHFKYLFEPCPIDAKWFRDKLIYWNTITKNYDLLCIERVISLWKDIEDRREVAVMINDSINPYTTNYKTAADISHIKHFMEVYMISDNKAEIWKVHERSPFNKEYLLNERIEELEKDKTGLQKRIVELEAEKERLNALLEKKKRNGTARKFTLVQIVEYCKSCVDWNDAKSVVAMLNKLLRRIGTKEDSDLVDSIETEFFNRRYGNTYIREQTVIPNVGNYKPEIQTQTMNVPLAPIKQEEQKLLYDE